LQIDQDKRNFFPSDQGSLPQLSFAELGCDPWGQLWLNALLERTLYRYDGKTVGVFPFGEKGLPADAVTHLYGFATGADGNLWAALGVDSAYCFDGASWRQYMPPKSLFVGSLMRIVADFSGRIWFVVSNESYTSFVWYDGKQWHEYARLSFGPEYDVVTAFVVDRSGTLWVGWDSQGVWSLESKSDEWTQYRTKNSALPDMCVFSMAVDRANRIWVGTGEGIAVFADKESAVWRKVTLNVRAHPRKITGNVARQMSYRKKDLRPIVAYHVVMDVQDRIWAWSGDGVCVFSEE
jgi:ligand-binding sensor domain-containing protein